MEWLIEMQTMPDATTDADAARRLQDALAAMAPEVRNPACKFDIEEGVVSAVFEVDATDAYCAAEVSGYAFHDALERCGLDPMFDHPEWRIGPLWATRRLDRRKADRGEQ